MSKLFEVFSSQSTLESQMKAHLLEQCGLQPILVDENLASTIGMGNNAVPCRILISEEQAKQALEILNNYEKNKDTSKIEPNHCPSCNADWEPGFSVCWNCQTSL
jgi:hypothetical protein